MKITIKQVKIIENRKIADGFYLMTFENKHKDQPAPGQFISLRIKQCSHLFRRPFSVFHFTPKKLQILYKVIGQTTLTMSQLNAGDDLEYMGFLGQGFQNKIQNKEIWLAAGGIGLGGVNLFVQKYLKANKLKLFIGLNFYQNAIAIEKFLKEQFKYDFMDISVIQKNSRFFKGNIVQLLNSMKGKPDRIIACGPELMLRNLYENYTRIKKIEAYFSMENVMACGIGACMGCNIRINTSQGIKTQRVCKEGPVFNAAEIVW